MLTTDFKQNTTKLTDKFLPSPAVWADCPEELIAEEPQVGQYCYDDFKDYPLIGTQTTQIGQGRYKVFNTGAGVVAPVATVNSVLVPGGALQVNLDTNNDSGSIAQSYPTLLLTGAPATSGKLWFEACVAVNSLLTDTMGFLLGLAEVDKWTLATGVPLNGGDPITNAASFIGFQKGEDGLGVVNTALSDRATAVTPIGAGEGLIAAAYTFTKLGFVYDPNKSADCVIFYQDNLALPTRYSKAQVLATTNLKANALGLLFALVADTAGTTAAAFLKWWRFAQLNPGQTP